MMARSREPSAMTFATNGNQIVLYISYSFDSAVLEIAGKKLKRSNFQFFGFFFLYLSGGTTAQQIRKWKKNKKDDKTDALTS